MTTVDDGPRRPSRVISAEDKRTGGPPLHRRMLRWSALSIMMLAAVVLTVGRVAAQQAPAPVGLGTADNVAVLGGQGVTNTGPTTVNGDLGSWPNPAITGAGLTVNGTIHAADAVAKQAQADTTTAYNDAAGRTPLASVATELGGRTLPAGVYSSSAGTFGITGTLTLDAQGDPDAVFVFQVSSTLITASSSNVDLINGATACNVFWQVGSSATLGTSSTFRGTILALASITVTTGVTIDGRVLARNGAVTLDTDTIRRATCETPQTTSVTISSSANPSDVGASVTFTTTVTAPGGGSPEGAVTYLDNGSPIGSVVIDGNGQGELTTTSMGAGDHTITAVYLGSPGFTSSTSAALGHVVNQATTTTVPPGTTTTVTSNATTTTAPPGTTTTTRSAAATAGPGSSTPTTPTGSLAATGSTPTRLLAAALLALVLGSTLIVASQRPNRDPRRAQRRATRLP